MSERTCLSCSKGPLPRRNKSGYCGSCWSKVSWTVMRADPAFEAKRIAGINSKIARDPAYKEQMRERMRKAASLPHATEIRRQKAIELRFWEKGWEAAPKGSEARIRGGKRLSDTRLAWCPRELRDQYKKLVRSNKIPAAEARVMILDLHEREMERFRQKLEAA